MCLCVCSSRALTSTASHFYMFLTIGCLQFSLPLPQGGRDAVSKNVILREDQLPQKFLYPKTKKKSTKQVCGLFIYFINLLFFYFNDNYSFYLIELEKVIDIMFLIACLQGDDFFVSDDIFSHHHSHKKAPFQPPVRKALAVFSGKRNPNDNHYSRSKHK